MISDCSLLVCSTDRYLAAARITIAQLQRLGISAMMDAYLTQGEGTPVIEGITVINRKSIGTWSSELLDALSALKTDYILLWLDDLIPTNIPSLATIETRINWAIKHRVSYLRLNPTPAGNGEVVAPGIRRVPPGSLYRTSTILSVWRREVLMALLDPTESAWQFELIGSKRSDAHRDFFAPDTASVQVVNLLVKGFVDPRAERILSASGIDVQGVSQKRLTASEVVSLWVRERRSVALRVVPWQFRRWLRQLFPTNLKVRS